MKVGESLVRGSDVLLRASGPRRQARRYVIPVIEELRGEIDVRNVKFFRFTNSSKWFRTKAFISAGVIWVLTSTRSSGYFPLGIVVPPLSTSGIFGEPRFAALEWGPEDPACAHLMCRAPTTQHDLSPQKRAGQESRRCAWSPVGRKGLVAVRLQEA